MPARDFSRRYSLFFACLFLGGGVQLPFLPLWLAHQGLGAPQIGVVVAAQIAVRAIGAPVGAFIADRLGARRRVMVLAAAIGSAINVALSFADGFPAILTLAILMAVFLAPVSPLGEAAAVEGSAHHNIDYGRMRLWGSLSFVAGGLLAGAALQAVPITWAVLFIALGNGILALACLSLPADAAKAQRPAGDAAPSWTMLLSAPFLAFLAATSLGQASHALLYGFGALGWDHAGYQKATIAAFWAMSIAAEVLLFAFSKRFTARLGGTGLILLGTAIGILRWPLMALDLPMALIFLVQILHALTFAALHLGAMVHIQHTVPKDLRNTAQGLYFAVTSGIAMSLAIWASGPLFAAFGRHGYLAMALMSCAAFAFALLLSRISPKAPSAPGA